MKSIKSIMPESALAASERGFFVGLGADGLSATHQTDEIAGVLRRAVCAAAAASFTPSLHQSISKKGLEAVKADSGLSDSDGPGWTWKGCRPSPGRTSPRPPHRPITDPRASDNADPNCRTSAVGSDCAPWGREDRPWDAARRDVLGHRPHSPVTGETGKGYRTFHRPGGSRTRLYRTGGKGKSRTDNPVPPPPAPRRAAPALKEMFGLCSQSAVSSL